MLNREPAGMINIIKLKCHHVTMYYYMVILCMTSFSPAFDRCIPPIFFDDFIFTKTVSIKGICKSGSKRNLHRVKQKRLELTGKCRKIFTGLKNNWEQTGNWESISPVVAGGVQGKWSLKLLEGILSMRAIADRSGRI